MDTNVYTLKDYGKVYIILKELLQKKGLIEIKYRQCWCFLYEKNTYFT